MEDLLVKSLLIRLYRIINIGKTDSIHSNFQSKVRRMIDITAVNVIVLFSRYGIYSYAVSSSAHRDFTV